MSELLPCPFCQSPRVHVTHIRDGLRVSCKDCLGEGPPVFYGPEPKVVTRDWAVRDWNRRTKAEPDPLLEQVADALRNLYALVCGECPSILENDHHDDLVCDALSAYRERMKG